MSPNFKNKFSIFLNQLFDGISLSNKLKEKNVYPMIQREFLLMGINKEKYSIGNGGKAWEVNSGFEEGDPGEREQI